MCKATSTRSSRAGTDRAQHHVGRCLRVCRARVRRRLKPALGRRAPARRADLRQPSRLRRGGDSQNNVLCECGAVATYLGQRLTLRDDGTIRLVYGVSAAQYASWAPGAHRRRADRRVRGRLRWSGPSAPGCSSWADESARRRHPVDRQRRQDDLMKDGTDLVIGWGTFDYAPCWRTTTTPELNNFVLVDKSRNDVHKLYMVTNDPTPYADGRWNGQGETGLYNQPVPSPRIAPPFGLTDPVHPAHVLCGRSTPTVAFAQNCTDWTCSTCDCTRRRRRGRPGGRLRRLRAQRRRLHIQTGGVQRRLRHPQWRLLAHLANCAPHRELSPPPRTAGLGSAVLRVRR